MLAATTTGQKSSCKASLISDLPGQNAVPIFQENQTQEGGNNFALNHRSLQFAFWSQPNAAPISQQKPIPQQQKC